MGETLYLKGAFLHWGKNIDNSKFNVLESAYQWPLPQMGLQAMINDDDEVRQWPWIALCQFKTLINSCKISQFFSQAELSHFKFFTGKINFTNRTLHLVKSTDIF